MPNSNHLSGSSVQNGITENGHNGTLKLINEPIKTICCIGAGYVGGPTCAVMALKCPQLQVHVVDIDGDRIDAWNSDQLPCYEPGLDDIVHKCRGTNLFFSTDIQNCVRKSQLIFISVNTPTKDAGFGKGKAPDMRYIESSARLIGQYAQTGHKIVVEKSTVPVNAAEIIRTILEAQTNGTRFTVLSNPEFLAEGTAIHNLLSPDRILIGGPNNEYGKLAINKLASIYEEWIPRERIITMNTWSAELSKLTANAVLSQRISSINSISAICEATGADIEEVSRAVGMDSRIGDKFLQPSLGFGGSCLQKDVLCLVYLAESLNLHLVADYWYKVIEINNWQKKRFAEKIVSSMFNSIAGKQICLLGFSFKKDTADIRESATIDVCNYLLEEGAFLRIYDPKVKLSQIQKCLTKFNVGMVIERVSMHGSAYEAANGVDALVVCTEWDEFKVNCHFVYLHIFPQKIGFGLWFDLRKHIQTGFLVRWKDASGL
ncbi:hypothetical protein ACOME3_004995 [Neoechinorhynchus agilis]